LLRQTSLLPGGVDLRPHLWVLLLLLLRGGQAQQQGQAGLQQERHPLPFPGSRASLDTFQHPPPRFTHRVASEGRWYSMDYQWSYGNDDFIQSSEYWWSYEIFDSMGLWVIVPCERSIINSIDVKEVVADWRWRILSCKRSWSIIIDFCRNQFWFIYIFVQLSVGTNCAIILRRVA